jgi:hypothetical protein
MFLRNVGKLLRPHPGRYSSPQSPLWEPQIRSLHLSHYRRLCRQSLCASERTGWQFYLSQRKIGFCLSNHESYGNSNQVHSSAVGRQCVWKISRFVQLRNPVKHKDDSFEFAFRNIMLIFLMNHIIHPLMELSPSWEAPNCAATEELSQHFMGPKVHYRINKSPPLFPILIHTISSYLTSIFILSNHLRLGLRSGLFPSGFSTNILHATSSPSFVLHALPVSSLWIVY